MKLLDRQIFRELVGPFLFGVAAFTSLMFASKELFRITELLAEYNASWTLAGRLVVLHLPSIVVLTLPMSMLLAALLGFGRLSGDSETVALFAGGVSLYRVILPVVIMAIGVTGLSLVLNEIIVPSANSEHERIVRELRDEPLSSSKPFLVVDADNGITNSVFYVQAGFDTQRRALRNVSLIQYSNNEPVLFVYGESAVWEHGNNWSFRNGYWKSISKESVQDGQTLTMSFEESKTVKISRTPEQLARYQKRHEELSFRELNDHIRMLENEGAQVSEYRVRLYQKIAIPLASLVFALVGAPLGLRPQRSSSAMGLGLAVVIIFSYWILLHSMTILGRNEAISPAAAAFIPTLVSACAGIALIVRASK